MAGCYGSSAEDRHFEGLLFRHLDQEDAWERKIEARLERLWDECLEKSEALEYDWELLLNQLPAILRRVAECHLEKARDPFHDSRSYAALGADIHRMLAGELQRLAEQLTEKENV